MAYKAMGGFGRVEFSFYGGGTIADQDITFENAFSEPIPKPLGVKHTFDNDQIYHVNKGFRWHLNLLLFNVDDGDSDNFKLLDEYLSYLHQNLIKVDILPNGENSRVNLRLPNMLLKLDQDIGYKKMARQNAGQTRNIEFYGAETFAVLPTGAQDETPYNLVSENGTDNIVTLSGDNIITLNGE